MLDKSSAQHSLIIEVGAGSSLHVAKEDFFIYLLTSSSDTLLKLDNLCTDVKVSGNNFVLASSIASGVASCEIEFLVFTIWFKKTPLN